MQIPYGQAVKVGERILAEQRGVIYSRLQCESKRFTGVIFWQGSEIFLVFKLISHPIG